MRSLLDMMTRALTAGLLAFSRRARWWIALGRRAWFHRLFAAFESLMRRGREYLEDRRSVTERRA